MSQQFKNIGSAKVAGVEPGGTISEDELVEHGVNVDALIEGGHLSGRNNKKPANAEKE